MEATSSIWELLGSIPVGTVAAWVAVLIAIVSAICAGVLKLYKVFLKYKEAKDKSEANDKAIHEYGEVLKEVRESLSRLEVKFKEQEEVNLKQLRRDIVHICDEAIAVNRISAGKLKLLEELFEEYTEVFHANGYVKTLVVKARKVPVEGKLDE